MNKALFFWLALLLVFAGGTSIWAGYKVIQASSRSTQVRSTSVEVARPGADEDWLTQYTLTDQTDQPFDSQQELDGQVHVVSFFFASCPHFCTFQNQRVAELYKEFAEQGVKFVSITCDPVNDTPARLNEYSKQFKADREHWSFLTGDIDYISRIGAEKYQVPVAPSTHSERLIVVDRWGNIRGMFHWNNPDEVSRMKETLAELLAETSPPPTEDTAPDKAAAPPKVEV